jgi:hypothetical protein
MLVIACGYVPSRAVAEELVQGPVVDGSRFDAAGNWIAPPERWEQVDDRMVAAAYPTGT